MKNQITWGQREGGYAMVKRQFNKSKWIELNYFEKGTWGIVLSYSKTIREAKQIAINHRRGH